MKYKDNSDLFYTKGFPVKITPKQHMMLSILTDILGENRSAIVRRLLIAEAKRVSAELKGEELELWVDLINQINKEEDYHRFAVGEAVSQGMKKAYFERTGKQLGYDEERNLKTLADKNRVWQRNYRAKKKLAKIKELEDKYGEK